MRPEVRHGDIQVRHDHQIQGTIPQVEVLTGVQAPPVVQVAGPLQRGRQAQAGPVLQGVVLEVAQKVVVLEGTTN